MPVTRSFGELAQKRIASDPAFAAALLREGTDIMLAGDVDAGKAILRDTIKATVGFENLAEAIGTPAKSLIRMLGPPHARSARQSAGAQPLRHHRLSAKAGRRRAARNAGAWLRRGARTARG
jgi:hypothetical protein